MLTGTTETCTYTAGSSSFTVPAGVSSITVVANGAAGGIGATNSGPAAGGPGGQTQATLPVTPGSSYNLEVASAGGNGVPQGAGGAGGVPGGGAGSPPSAYSAYCSVCAGGGGGGATLFGTGDLTNASNWLLVAGGGGGGSFYNSSGGVGGGLTGTGSGGGWCAEPDTSYGSGGNQTGTTGSGTQLNGSPGFQYEGGGGGGGGYWGGAGGFECGGGGGSGFVAPSITGTTTAGAGSTGDGSLTISWTAIPTTTTAAPAALGLLSITFHATLTRSDTGAGISGQTITFSEQGQTVCHGTTNSTGTASCTVLGLVLGKGTYTATFAGNPPYLASSGTSQL